MTDKFDNIDNLMDIVKNSLEEFIRNDKILLEIDAAERTICHRIALHIENMYNDLKKRTKFNIPKAWVDCEYNRAINHSNKQNEIKKIRICSNNETKPQNFRFNPDIVLHNRVPEGNEKIENLIVIEVKKTNNGNNDRIKDIKRLREATDPNKHYKFTLGVYIDILYEQKSMGIKKFLLIYFRKGVVLQISELNIDNLKAEILFSKKDYNDQIKKIIDSILKDFKKCKELFEFLQKNHLII